MQVFEFHFNPKLKPDLIFDCFCYEPGNIYEKRVGSLYMAGLLKNALPQNLQFLNNLSRVIKEKYYRPSLTTPEKQLKESLRQGNEFLEKIAKSGDVSWLGNLSFAVLSLKNFELNFTKVGDFKIFLLRRGRIIDIDQKLRFQEITPWPLKIFGNIVSGKLAENDIILVLTKEVSEAFLSQNLLDEIAELMPFDERGLREILKKKEEELSKISGICLLIFLSKEVLAKKRETILPRPKEFSLKDVFSQIINPAKKLIKKFRFPLLKFPKLKLPKIIKGPTPVGGRWAGWRPKLSKNLILILALIFLLALGFFISQMAEKEKLKKYQTDLNEIQEKVEKAESFLILKETKPQLAVEANSLLKESWEKISQMTKIAPNLPSDFSNQVFALKDKISKNLYQLNKLVEISEPEIFFEFNPEKFIPQKMIVFNKGIYFFSPYSKNLFKFAGPSEAGYPKGEVIQIDKKFNLAATLADSVLFFSKPNQLTILTGREVRGPAEGWEGGGRVVVSSYLEEPYPDFNFDDFSTFKSNLYFFDKKSGEIIKYPHLGELNWGPPQIWLDPKTKRTANSKSMAVDGSIWILDKNSVSKYYGGNLIAKIAPDIFPLPKEFSKIFTSPLLPYLYILEPVQKRIIILNKNGQIIKQFQSEKFDNLLDFSVSKDGKTIWLLNGLRVYKIEFTS